MNNFELTSKLNLPDRPILLDGGMGRELRFRGIDILTAIWSANALIVAPDTVRQIHQDFISAGADIITTNTYGIIRSNLAQKGLEDHFEKLNNLACQLARQARQKSKTSVLIAGSLPPLAGSYRPGRIGRPDGGQGSECGPPDRQRLAEISRGRSDQQADRRPREVHRVLP